MADADIEEDGGGDFVSINGFIGDGTTGDGDTGTIKLGWDNPDTTPVTWDHAVTIVAVGDAKQDGKQWETPETTYRHRVTSGHAFTVTDDVTMTDVIVQNASTSSSDECFRCSGSATYDFDFLRCVLGFEDRINNQDIVYCYPASTNYVWNFTNCIMVGSGRTVCHDETDSSVAGTFTVNMNSCDLSAMSTARTAAYDNDNPSSSATIVFNAHNCQFDQATDQYIAEVSQSGTTFNVSCTYGVTDRAESGAFGNADSTTVTGMLWSKTFVEGAPAADEVGLTEIFWTDSRLVDDPDNVAQEAHAVLTASSLTIPDTDILGQERDTNTPEFDIGCHALTLQTAGGGRVMSSLANAGGLAGPGGIAGQGGGLAG